VNRPLNVLVVEDSPTVREMLLAVLTRADPGVSTEGVTTLAEASARLADAARADGDAVRRIDAVLLDIHLPDADGIEAVEKLHALAPSVPIVVLTGMSGLDLEGDTLKAGAEDFHEKTDLDVLALVRSIRKAAVRHAVRQKHEPLREEIARTREEIKRVGEALRSDDPLARARELPSPPTQKRE
jgi:CheY-like chemotaxis protein